MSMTETVFNTAIGYAINTGAQVGLFPLFGVHIPIHANLMLSGIFTVISVARSYCVRRLFNYIHTAPVAASTPTA